MDFSVHAFSSEFNILSDEMSVAGAPFLGDDQFIHVSLHYSNSSSNAAAVDGPHPVCWARISENEYMDKNPDWSRRRSDTQCLRSCTITFWSDGSRFDCCDETRAEYREVAAMWLKCYVRNEAGNPNASNVDDTHTDDFAIIEGCDGRHENNYIEYEPEEEEDDNENFRRCRDARMYAKRNWGQKA